MALEALCFQVSVCVCMHKCTCVCTHACLGGGILWLACRHLVVVTEADECQCWLRTVVTVWVGWHHSNLWSRFVRKCGKMCDVSCGEYLLHYSHEVESVGFRKCAYDHQLTNKVISQWQTVLRFSPQHGVENRLWRTYGTKLLYSHLRYIYVICAFGAWAEATTLTWGNYYWFYWRTFR